MSRTSIPCTSISRITSSRRKAATKPTSFCAKPSRRQKKVGIAKVVIKTRQYLAGVKPEKHVLVLELMHFAEELADPDKLQRPEKAQRR